MEMVQKDWAEQMAADVMVEYKRLRDAADLDVAVRAGTVAVCAEIKRRLRARGCRWVSVTHGRGTASGWIDISAGPRY